MRQAPVELKSLKRPLGTFWARCGLAQLLHPTACMHERHGSWNVL